MIEVRVPDEQEGTKAVVRSWLKQVGDSVAGQVGRVGRERAEAAAEGDAGQLHEIGAGVAVIVA